VYPHVVKTTSATSNLVRYRAWPSSGSCFVSGRLAFLMRHPAIGVFCRIAHRRRQRDPIHRTFWFRHCAGTRWKYAY